MQIRRLSPSELEPFLAFMDGPAFQSQPQWQGCYCQFYLNTKAENEAGVQEQAEANRLRACDRTEQGAMNGYLAFEDTADGEQVIGWMAANKARNFVQLPPAPEDVAVIICFVVDQAHQGRGVATQLLEFALADLPQQGFRQVMAAPLSETEFVSHGYRGPRSMFEKAGFTPGPMVDDKHILMTRSL
jgi:GNAT superfamily N-acetyltransferase